MTAIASSRRHRNCALLRIRAEAELREAAETHRQNIENHTAARADAERRTVALAMSETALRARYESLAGTLDIALLRSAQLALEEARLQLAKAAEREQGAQEALTLSQESVAAKLRYRDKIDDFRRAALEDIARALQVSEFKLADASWLARVGRP